MHCIWLEEQKLTYRTDLPIPIPGEADALIKVVLAGICNTDLELLRGYYPFSGIPGHEFVGEVVNSPKDARWVGKRVVGEINIACGECTICTARLPQHCERRRTLGIHDWNGVFAEYLTLPLNNLHPIPDDLADECAVFTEPVAAACEILEQVTIQKHDRVLVIGAGRLGQLVAQVLQNNGCSLEVVARHPRQQQILAGKHIQAISEADLSTKKYDVIVEASGSPEGYSLARQCIRPRGTIVLKSTYKGNVQVNISGLVVDEINLIGSRCGPFEPALQLLAEGRVDPQPLIDATYSLDQGLAAFEHAARSGAVKILIRPG